jgi:uncharacterized membrane protein YeaQ/YmgE (transglycosylase-associated protein family)
MHILWMLIIGLVAGALAKLIMPGKDPGGVIVTMLLGVAGSFVAGFLGRSIGHYQAGDRPGLIASVIGAIIILGIYRLYLRATHRGPTTQQPDSRRLTRP